MFGFFRKKKKSETAAVELAAPAQPDTAAASSAQQYQAAPGTEIRYQPDLLPQLKDDHQELLSTYAEIQAAFEHADYGQVSQKLGVFRSALLSHLLTENVRLYVYLGHSLAADEFNAELVREFRREMDGIAKVVMKFLSKYEEIGVDKDLAASFGKDLVAIGAALTERIHKEERVLYPLYLPHY